MKETTKARLSRLETGLRARDRSAEYLDVYFRAVENVRRKEAGLEPLPYREEDREPVKPPWCSEADWEAREKRFARLYEDLEALQEER